MPHFAIASLVRIALRFLLGAPRTGQGRVRLIGAVLGVTLSMIPLVVVQQVADGMIMGIVNRFIETGTYHIRARSRNTPPPEELESIISTLSAIPGVTTVIPERQGFGLVYSDTGRSGVTLRALPQVFWDNDPAVRDLHEVVAGAFDIEQDSAIVLGVEIARRLAVEPGDAVRVLTVRPVGEGRMLPRVSRFTVTGVVSTGYRDLDRLWSYIPRARGMRVIPDESARELIGIKVQHPYQLDNPLIRRFSGDRAAMNDAYRQISESLGSEWIVQDWYHAERGRYISFLTSRNLLAFVMTLIVAVAALNISSALVLLSVEKQDEIAVLRSLGASRHQIAGIFVIAGSLVGTLGAVAGALIGVFLSVNINPVLRTIEVLVNLVSRGGVDFFDVEFYLAEIPVILAVRPVLGAVASAILFATLAALIPARRASSVLPERVLRNR